MSLMSSKVAADRNPTHHQFEPGNGYVNHGGPPQIPNPVLIKKNCVPKANAQDGSEHQLRAPTGAIVVLKWLPTHQAWGSPSIDRGNRLAWTADYLSNAGWEYMKPAKVR
jgi:hypothetical protein